MFCMSVFFYYYLSFFKVNSGFFFIREWQHCYYAVKFSGRRQLRQLLVELIFKLQQPESEPVLDIISGYATLRMQLR